MSQLCLHLGLVVNDKKSMFTPKQDFVFLGFRLDLLSFMCFPTQDRRVKIQDMCQKILAQKGAIAYEWQVLLGRLASTEKAVLLGRLHTRESLFHLRRCWDFNPSMNRRFVRKTQATTDELNWWTQPHNTWQNEIYHALIICYVIHMHGLVELKCTVTFKFKYTMHVIHRCKVACIESIPVYKVHYVM